MRPMPELKIETAKVDDLLPYVGNAKLHPHEQVEEIAQSIMEFGFNDPIGAWHDKEGNAVVVEGHGRLMAARKLGIKQVPVVFLDGLTDDQRRAYALVHNKTTQDSGFDPETILREMEELDGFDWESFGFDPINVADELSAMDDWKPVQWEDDEADEVLTAFVVTVRLRGEEQKQAMLERVGGDTLRRMYRVGDMR